MWAIDSLVQIKTEDMQHERISVNRMHFYSGVLVQVLACNCCVLSKQQM